MLLVDFTVYTLHFTKFPDSKNCCENSAFFTLTKVYQILARSNFYHRFGPGYWKDSEEKFVILVTSRALLFKKLSTRIYQTFSRNERVHIAFYQTFGFGFTVKITVHMVTSHALLLKKRPTRIYQTFSRLYSVHIAFYQTIGFLFTV